MKIKPLYEVMTKEELSKLVSEYTEIIESYRIENEELKKQAEKIERYEKALKFYATKNYYEPWREEDEDRTDAFNFIDLDGGETAREALRQEDEE
jgi:ribosome-binding protein aMBF1 (putative translation factor)